MGTAERRRADGTPLQRRGWEVNKHTPGPWELRGTRLVTDKHGVVIAEKVGSNGGGSESNARLIASAPELLELLERMVRAFNVKEIDPLVAFVTIEQARVAIAKARGES